MRSSTPWAEPTQPCFDRSTQRSTPVGRRPGNVFSSRLGSSLITPTLRASLSCTFLQTLPDLVTPLKGHSLSPRSCPATRSAPSETFGYSYDCRSNLAPKHARKHETHPPRVKKDELRLDSNDCGFICAGVNFVGGYKWHALFYWVVCNKRTTVWTPTKNCSSADSFLTLWRN